MFEIPELRKWRKENKAFRKKRKTKIKATRTTTSKHREVSLLSQMTHLTRSEQGEVTYVPWAVLFLFLPSLGMGRGPRKEGGIKASDPLCLLNISKYLGSIRSSRCNLAGVYPLRYLETN